MGSLSVLPPHALDQILGQVACSYLVIRLWLCGDRKFNVKLSKGLSLLALNGHLFSDSPFPRLVFEFHQLRYLTVSSPKRLTRATFRWPEIVKMLPRSLESLTISHNDDVNDLPWPAMESLSRLHTFVMQGPVVNYFPSSIFPALPASLTKLSAPLDFHYPSGDRAPLSNLPRALLILQGFKLSFVQYQTNAAAESFASDLLNAPPNLQLFEPVLWPQSYAAQVAPSEEWILPSLTELDWARIPTPYWTQPLALSLLSKPSINLQTLRIHFADLQADSLPRSLTTLSLHIYRATDLLSQIKLLPRSLTSLSLSSEARLHHNEEHFGAWATVDGCQWPPDLIDLALVGSAVPSQHLANLPQTINKLSIAIAHTLQKSVSTKLLPPSLTDLQLTTFSKVSLDFDHLKTCILIPQQGPGEDEYTLDNLAPASLTHLVIPMKFRADRPNSKPPTLPAGLTTLCVSSWPCSWFECLPRGLQHFETETLDGTSESPLTASGRLFDALPPSLKQLKVTGRTSTTPNSSVLPPQNFDSVPSLQVLVLLMPVHSSFLHLVPRSLTHLEFMPRSIKEESLPLLPPRLNTFIALVHGRNVFYSKSLASKLPLAALVSFRDAHPDQVLEVAKKRIQSAAKHI